ncbi:MAG: TetR family transcriptional regulator [Rubrivivax sp.]
MVRKTKEEALVTRGRILDAAERLFHEHGVSGTSLHHIAQAAGVTRGAVYWHFQDKGDLFNAMMDRIVLPMEEESDSRLGRPDDPTPLLSLRDHLLDVLRSLASDDRVRRVFEIATHKVEYVGELDAVRVRHLQARDNYVALTEAALRSAQRLGQVPRQPSARQLALGFHALIKGLIQDWTLTPERFDLMAVGRSAIDAYLRGVAAPRAPAA